MTVGPERYYKSFPRNSSKIVKSLFSFSTATALRMLKW